MHLHPNISRKMSIEELNSKTISNTADSINHRAEIKKKM
jgi:hypothetical protein